MSRLTRAETAHIHSFRKKHVSEVNSQASPWSVRDFFHMVLWILQWFLKPKFPLLDFLDSLQPYHPSVQLTHINSITMGLGTVEAVPPLSLPQLFTLATSILLLYGTTLVAYRLFFHPLRKIPGPILARSTYWYEFYEDIILKGHYVKSYPKLHKKYGELCFFVDVACTWLTWTCEALWWESALTEFTFPIQSFFTSKYERKQRIS